MIQVKHVLFLLLTIVEVSNVNAQYEGAITSRQGGYQRVANSNQPRIENGITISTQSKPIKRSQSQTLRSFLAWRDAAGLKSIFKVVNKKIYRADNGALTYRLTLDTGNLENVIGEEASHDLYAQALSKLAATSGFPVARLELAVMTNKSSYFDTGERAQLPTEKRISAKNGEAWYATYCDPITVLKVITLETVYLDYERETIKSNTGIRCSIAVDSIEEEEEIIISAVERANKSRAINRTIDKGSRLTTKKIRSAISRKLFDPSARISFSKITENFIFATIRNIRGVVIFDKRYWEKLQIIIFLDRSDEETVAKIILDGQYAAGLLVPTDFGYSDMEPVYASYLNEYGKSLLLALQEVK